MRMLIVTTMRNEAPFAVEWIAHHRALGFTDFLIYSNDCDDGTDTLLDALGDDAGVTHLPNPAGSGGVQWAALKAASAHPLTKTADWILVADCDEFLNLRAPLVCVGDLIAACEGADAIALGWRLFGHGGAARATDAPVCDAFNRAAPADCAYPVATAFFKTLFRRQGPFGALGVHRPKQKRAPRFVDGSGRRLPAQMAERQGRIQLYGLKGADGLAVLNHYAVRSAESFMIKRDRGLPNRGAKAVDLNYWVERNFNTTSDTSIARHRDAREGERARLLALPGVAEAQAAGRAWHRARFAELMRDPANVQLFGRLLMASGSEVPQTDLVHDLLHWYGAAVRDGTDG